MSEDLKQNKVVSERTISFTEYTYEDGNQCLKPKTDDFTDFELLGILKYYIDVFTVQMIRKSNKK